MFIITYGQYHLNPTQEGAEKLLKIQKKIEATDEPIDLRDVKSSFLHSYLQNYREVCADLQRHYPVDIKSVSIADYYNYYRTIRKLYDQNKSK